MALVVALGEGVTAGSPSVLPALGGFEERPGLSWSAGFPGAHLSLAEGVPRLVVATREGPRTVTLEFPGAARRPALVPELPLPGTVNYLLGCDPGQWRSATRYGQVRCRAVYPGVDLLFRTPAAGLEYDLVAEPGCLPPEVEVAVVGADALNVDAEGSLVARVGEATVTQLPPRVYQEGPAGRTDVAAAFRLVAADRARIVLGALDAGRAITIDPIIVLSTFVGGTDSDSATAVAVGPGGDLFVAGTTWSTDFPVVGPFQAGYAGGVDAFVARMDAAGNLIYATYLGGTSYDDARSVAVDASGQAVVVGLTVSGDFPVAAAPQPAYAGAGDAFVAKLDATGSSLVFSTYLGGGGEDTAQGVAVDAPGMVHVVGTTSSSNFPVAQPFQAVKAGSSDAFVTRIPPAGGTFAFSTYLGGRDADGGAAVDLDVLGNTYLAGTTASTDFPVRSPYQPFLAGYGDAFIARIDTSGYLRSSTYFGGGQADQATGLAVDASGNVAIGGNTESFDFPLANAVQRALKGRADGFVARLSPANTLLLSTYLGGVDSEYAGGVALAQDGDIVLVGSTYSADFPVVEPVQRGMAGRGGMDAFVSRIDAAGFGLVMSTLVGGSEWDVAAAVVVDAADVACVVGRSGSRDFPSEPPFRPFGGAGDAFLLRLAQGKQDPIAQFTLPSYYPGVTFLDNSVGPVTSYAWSFGDGHTSSSQNPTHAFFFPGQYTVSLQVSGPGGTDTETKPGLVEVVTADFSATPRSGPPPLTVAFSSLAQGPVRRYEWYFGDGGTSTDRDPVHTYTAAGTYHVWFSARGRVASAAIDKFGYIDVGDAAAEFAGAPRLVEPPGAVHFTDLSTGLPTSWLWDFGDGATSTQRNPSHVYRSAGFYTVELTVTGTMPNTEMKPYYVWVGSFERIVTGPGPDPAAPAWVLARDLLGQWAPPTFFYAYGTPGFGANVAVTDLDAGAADEILTGPGPSPVYGPHVRGFTQASAAVPGVSFYAYGTLRYGVGAVGFDLGGAAGHGILTGAGPGGVFAPHVRGFDYDGTAVRAIPDLSFFAYSYPSYGANVSGGDLEGRGQDDIVTGPGPGMAYPPLVRGFRHGPGVWALPGVYFFGMAVPQAGANVDAGHMNSYAGEEIVVSGGPGPDVEGEVRWFSYVPPIVTPVGSCKPFQARMFGVDARAATGGTVFAGSGADPAGPAVVRSCCCIDFLAYASRYGVNVAPVR